MTEFNQSRMNRGEPTLGMTIRALRMGYKWFCPVGGFLRISRTDDSKVIRIELMPCQLIEKFDCTGDRHVAWWKIEESDSDLHALIKPLKNLIRIKCKVLFYVNEQGELI